MERFVTVQGWSRHHQQMDKLEGLDQSAKGPKPYETGYIVYWWDGNRKVDYEPDIDSKPITLRRCREILDFVERKTGNIYTKITITDNRFADDHTAIYRKKWVYNKAKNRLTIWAAENGERDMMPVYENWDGHQICRDRDALADCLL